MSRRSANSTQSVSLFPFLDVLVCTMGCLILLMLGIIHQGENKVRSGELILPGTLPPAVATVKPAPDLPVVATPPVSQPEPLPSEPDFLPATPSQVTTPGTAPDPELAAEHDRLRQNWQDKVATAESEKEQKAREALEAQTKVAKAQQRLHQVQTEMRLTREQLAALEAQHAELQKSGEGSQSEQQKLLRQIAQAQRSLELLKRKQATAPNEFAFVPYDGASGTTRRPLYVECTDSGFHILPEDVWIKPQELEGCSERVNPLLVSMSTLRDYWLTKSHSKDDPDPYLLLIVRPNGTVAYYVARKLLNGFQGPFGYELVDKETKLSFGEADPGAKAALQRSLEQAYALRDERLKELAGDFSSGKRRGATRSLRNSDPESIGEILRERGSRRPGLRRESTSVADISHDARESSTGDGVPTRSDAKSRSDLSKAKPGAGRTSGDLAADGDSEITSVGSNASKSGKAGRGPDSVGSDQKKGEGGTGIAGPPHRKSRGDTRAPRAASISGRDDDDLPLSDELPASRALSTGNRIRQAQGARGAVGLPEGIPEPLIRPVAQAGDTGVPEIDGGTQGGKQRPGDSGDRVATNEGLRRSRPRGNPEGSELLPLDGAAKSEQHGLPGAKTQTVHPPGTSLEPGTGNPGAAGQASAFGGSPGADDELPRLDDATDALPSSTNSHPGDPSPSTEHRTGGSEESGSSPSDANGFHGRKGPNRRPGKVTRSDGDTTGYSSPYSGETSTGEDSQTFSGMVGGPAGATPPGNPPAGGVDLTLSPPGQGDDSGRHGGKQSKSWTFGGGRRGIGLQKSITIHAMSDRLLIGPDNFAIPAGQGESRNELVQQVTSGIIAVSKEWGAPPANFHWVASVKFKVYPGGNQHYERVQGALREHGISSTVEYALDGAPQESRRGAHR